MNLTAPIPLVPSLASSEVKSLSNNLVPEGKLLYLNIEVAPNAIVKECYTNVKEYIKKNGGGVQYGWCIWETFPKVMLEAEFHAVWVDDVGELHDITPRAKKELSKILFLVDPISTYKGKQVNNIRIALVDDEIVHNFIKYQNRYFEITNRGVNALENGLLEMTVTPELRGVLMNLDYYHKKMLEKYFNNKI